MQFRFDEDQLAMRDTVRAMCANHFDLARVGEREGEPATAVAWAALADLGVLGMLAGDSGVGLVDAALVFEELGAHLASGPVLWSALLAPFAPGLADGRLRAAGVELDARGASAFVVEHAGEADVV